jgi:hypothetical protein
LTRRFLWARWLWAQAVDHDVDDPSAQGRGPAAVHDLLADAGQQRRDLIHLEVRSGAAAFIAVLRVRDGRIALWREYQNTLALAMALGADQ